jgi:methionyl-tRNA formyltransferase
MRVLVFSLIDDWDLGQRLKLDGHEIVGWVKPSWDEKPVPGRLSKVVKAVAKKILSQETPGNNITPKYDTFCWLSENNIPRIKCDNVNAPSFVAYLESQRIDLILVGMFPQIFKPPVLQVPKFGVINYHPSLLPSYAGPQPSFWMIKNGERVAGITIHSMIERVDAGDILAQQCFDIDPGENLGQLLQRQHHYAAKLLADTVDAIAHNRLNPSPQDLTARSYFKRRQASDAFINWSGSAVDQVNLLRASQPFEPLLTRLNGRTIRIFQMHYTNSIVHKGRVGQVLLKNGSRFVAQAGTGCLEVTRYEIEPFHGWINELIQFYFPRVGDCFDVQKDS